MPDASHAFGVDLQVTATGDLALADGLTLSQQRILRRLLTNPGDYIWHPEYGAGLPKLIGQNLNVPAIRSAIRSQIFAEASVSQNPPPTIAVSQGASPGDVFVQITYVDAQTGQQASLSFDLSP